MSRLADPASYNDPRRHVQVHAERVGAVGGSEFPGHYPGEDHSWNLQKFQDDLIVDLQRMSPSTVEFDLVGVDSSIANALRRILIAEVPTMAFEAIYVWNNTSIMQDEVLCHRLGLVPIKVDPRRFQFKEGDAYTDKNSLVFDLRVRCDRNPEGKDSTDPRVKYFDSNVYAGMINFGPQQNQLNEFGDALPTVVNPDILLVKLRPGQTVDMDLFAVKGRGSDHAKFSPVATASYRLLPHIIIRQPIPRELHVKFRDSFPEGVIGIEEDANGEPQCVVKNARKDTVTREVLRHKEFEGLVELDRIRDHFLFSIESAGQYAPQDLIPEAISIMLGKISEVERGLDRLFDISGAAA